MFIYLDNAATTRVSDAALDAMLPYFRQQYGNPSSLYAFGQEAKEALEHARETVAGVLNCEPREIIFTSGGSEADNQAIRSAADIGARAGKRHIISTAFEHHAVLHTLSKLEKEGFETEPENMAWVGQYSNANLVKTDFFEARSTAYAKSTALVDDL